MKRIYRNFIVIISLLFLISCGGKTYMQINEIPIPEGVTDEKIEGAYEKNLDNASNKILADLKKDFSDVSDKIYIVSGETDWDTIKTFYAGKLDEKGFERDGEILEDHKDYKIAVWRMDGILSKEIVAVALIDTGDNKKFLNIFHAK